MKEQRLDGKITCRKLRKKVAASLDIAHRDGGRNSIARQDRFLGKVLFEGADKLGALFVGVVSRLRKLNTKRNPIFGSESEPDPTQFGQTEACQGGADQDQHRDGGLEHNHRLLPPNRRRTLTASTRFGPQRFGERNGAGLPCGEESAK